MESALPALGSSSLACARLVALPRALFSRGPISSCLSKKRATMISQLLSAEDETARNVTSGPSRESWGE